MCTKLNLQGVLLDASTILMLMFISFVTHAEVIAYANCTANVSDYYHVNDSINAADQCTIITNSPFTEPIKDSASVSGAAVAGASFDTRGEEGNLGVRADSFASTTSSTYPLAAGAWSTVSLYSNDSVSITSETLASGSTVSINVSGYFEGMATGYVSANLTECPNCAESYSYVKSHIDITEILWNGTIQYATFVFNSCFGYSQGDCVSANGDYYESYSAMIEVDVGSTLLINSSLLAYSSSSLGTVGTKHVEGWSEASSMNSLVTFLTPTNDGVQLSAESGHDYGIPTQVPEPGTWFLMLPGLALIGAAVRGRRQKNALT